MGHRNGPVAGTADHTDDDTDEKPGEDGPEDTEAPSEAAPPRASRRSVPLWTAVILLALALVGGYLLGRPSQPLDTGPDAGFLRDMSAHHAQAVDMSMLILEESEDPELRTVATDIARTQQAQIGIMQGWLMAWELNSRGAQPPMTWMEGHDHGGGDGETPDSMPGLASPEEMEALETTGGVEAEILFLELMIAHHHGGVDMAEAEVSLGREDLVVDLAQGMVESQQKEIDLMEEMITQREGEASGD